MFGGIGDQYSFRTNRGTFTITRDRGRKSEEPWTVRFETDWLFTCDGAHCAMEVLAAGEHPALAISPADGRTLGVSPDYRDWEFRRIKGVVSHPDTDSEQG